MSKRGGGARRWWALAAGGPGYLGWRPVRSVRTADLRGQVVVITDGSRALPVTGARASPRGPAREGAHHP